MKMFLTNAWHRPVLITSRWWMSCWTWRRPETSQTSLWTNFQKGFSPWRTSSWRRPLGEERLDKLAQFRDLSEKMIREPWLLQSHQLQSCLLPISAKRKILCKLLLKFPLRKWSSLTAKHVSNVKGLTFSSLQCLLLRSYFPAFLVVSYWTGLDLHAQCPGHNCSLHRRCTDRYNHKRRNQLFEQSSSLKKKVFKFQLI